MNDNNEIQSRSRPRTRKSLKPRNPHRSPSINIPFPVPASTERIEMQQDYINEFQYDDCKVVQQVSKKVYYDRKEEKLSVETTFKNHFSSPKNSPIRERLRIKDNPSPKLEDKPKKENLNSPKQPRRFRPLTLYPPRREEDLSWKHIIATLFLISAIANYFLVFYSNWFFNTDYPCGYEYNLPLIKSNLNNKIFGQKAAMDSLTYKLEEFYEENYTNYLILLFVGPTGVGKTYTARILSEYFKNVNFFYYYNDDFPNYIRESNCDNEQLLVIDDLDLEAVTPTIKWLQTVFSKEPKYKTLLILIMNLKHSIDYDPETINQILSEDRQSIRNKFDNTKLANVGIINFDLLTKDSIIECIKDSALKLFKKVDLSDDEINIILDKIPENNCKRVNKQLEYLFTD